MKSKPFIEWLDLNDFDSGFYKIVQYDSGNQSSKNGTKIFSCRKMGAFFPKAILREN